MSALADRLREWPYMHRATVRDAPIAYVEAEQRCAVLLLRVKDAHIRDYRHLEEGQCPTPDAPNQSDPTCYLCGLNASIIAALDIRDTAVAALLAALGGKA